MVKLRQIGTSRIAVAAAAAVLASAGAAVAASDGNGNGNGNSGQGQRGGQPHGQMGGPGGHADMRFLTYSETHTYKNGKETVQRTDAGKIKSVSASEITLTERDGNDVTIALSEDTEVLIPGNEDATVDDLTVGQKVIVHGEKGQPADVVGVPPKKGQRPSRPKSNRGR